MRKAPKTNLRRHTAIACALAAAAAALLLGGLASAAREPTSAQRRIIVQTVHDSKLTAQVADDRYDVRHIILSTVRTPGRLYGRIVLVPHDQSLDGATGIVRRFHRHWRLIDLGTAGVGCKLPAAVRRDLRLQCP
jgi:hypothetical protein